MWKKHVLLPLWAGLVSCVPALHAYDGPQAPKQGLYFIENKGQIMDQHHQKREDLDFKLNAGNGLTIFLGSGKIEYQWSRSQNPSPMLTSVLASGDPEQEYIPAVYDLYRMDVRLVGADPNANVIREGQHPYYERHYLPAMPQEGAKAGAWQKITYKEVYPHIDWVFYFNTKGQLEHDFVVRHGGKVSDIRLQYGGATQVQLLADGSLLANTPLGTAKDHAPIAYDGSGKAIPSQFILRDNVLTFDVAPYNGTLIIDPILEWGTYFGGPDLEAGRAITTDKEGYVYLTGTTGSLSNIASTGAFQTTYGGGSDGYGADAFLSKWNKEGQLLWCTFYGGSAIDIALAISCDTADKIYLAGYTNSKDVMSTPGSYQELKAGTSAGNDCFLAQFDNTGQRIWSTYYGGTGTDGSVAVGLTTNRFGNIYLTGNTASTGGIATAGAHQTTRGTGSDAFLAKFNNSGQLIWGTYYGGNSNEYPQGCAIDSTGNLYITGYTQSTTGIATSGAYQNAPSGKEDAFICKFSPEGALVWGTYFGGQEMDRATSIAAQNEIIYIGGVTLSTTGIATGNAHQTQIGGREDGFMAAFNKEGHLQWGTYYGGEDSEVILGIYSGSTEQPYICGYSTSKKGIATSGAHKEELVGAGGSDLFLVKFDSSGKRIWGTYYGGLDNDHYGYITGDNSNNLYLTGITSSPTQIATTNAYQNNLNGVSDVILVRFNDCPKPELPDEIQGAIKACDATVHRYSINKVGNNHYQWLLPPSWDLIKEEDSLLELRIQGDGLLQIVAINDCGAVSDTQSLWIAVSPRPQPIIQNNNYILSTTKSYATYQWFLNEIAIPGAMQATYVAKEDGLYSVWVMDRDSCTGQAPAIEVTGSVSVNTMERKLIPAPYPNPAQHQITVSLPGEAILEIFTLEGRKIRTNRVTSKGTISLPLNDLANGLYLLKIETSTYTTISKFIKQQ